MKLGGAGTQFTAARAQWSNDQSAIMYPSPWITNEMKKQTKAGFKMTGCPEFVLTDSPKMGYDAMDAAPGEPFILPKKAVNAGAGKEFMRAMLSKDAATNFAKTILPRPSSRTPSRPTASIHRPGVPHQDAGRRRGQGLLDQVRRLLRHEHPAPGAVERLPGRQVLGGRTTKGMQEISDKIADDSSVKKITVK